RRRRASWRARDRHGTGLCGLLQGDRRTAGLFTQRLALERRGTPPGGGRGGAHHEARESRNGSHARSSLSSWRAIQPPAGSLSVQSDAPAGDRLARRIQRGRDRPAIHEEDGVLAGRAVAPQDVGLAVAVVVPDAHDLPVEVRYWLDAPAADYGGAVHGPDRVLSGRAVAPQDVDLAVAVEVTDPDDLPVRVRHRGGVRGAAESTAVHEPDLALTGALVVPQDVGLAVTVEVAGAGDDPVEIRHRGERGRARDRRSVHEPEHVLARRAVTPQDVGRAAAVEVIDGVLRHDRRRWWWWWCRTARDDDEVDGRS